MSFFGESILKGLLKSLKPGRSLSAGLGKVLRLPNPPPDYGCALERSAQNLLQRQAALDRERAAACALLGELLGHPAERQLERLRRDGRFHTWGALERLLELGRDELLADSRECERLTALALALADCLESAYYGPTRIADMRARGAVTLGEARRLRSDFTAAEQAFAAAREHLGAGTGDSLEQAFLLDAEAALRRCQRRFGAARDLLLQALEIFVENGEGQRAGLCLVGLAAVHRDDGQADRALPLLHEAEQRIDRERGEREPRLLLCVQHNLADCLAAAGRCMEARGILLRSRPLYRRFPDGWTQGHLRWLRGKVALGLGEAAEAEAELLGARTTFLARGAAFEAGLAVCDLAPLFTRQERAAELAALASEAAQTFTACGVACEAQRAQIFCRQAEEIEGAWQELARAAGAFRE
jgi:hypothetical protein